MFWAFASVKQVRKVDFLSCIQFCMSFFCYVLIVTELLFFIEIIFFVIHMVTYIRSDQDETLITQYRTFHLHFSLQLQYTQILTTKQKSYIATTGLPLSSFTSQHKLKYCVIPFLSCKNIWLPLQALLSPYSTIR